MTTTSWTTLSGGHDVAITCKNETIIPFCKLLAVVALKSEDAQGFKAVHLLTRMHHGNVEKHTYKVAGLAYIPAPLITAHLPRLFAPENKYRVEVGWTTNVLHRDLQGSVVLVTTHDSPDDDAHFSITIYKDCVYKSKTTTATNEDHIELTYSMWSVGLSMRKVHLLQWINVLHQLRFDWNAVSNLADLFAQVSLVRP